MDELELIDETFDSNRTEVYELSIQVNLNGFSFAVKDTIRNTFISLISKYFATTVTNNDNWGSAVDEILSAYPIVSQKFKKKFFSFTPAGFSIVPEEIFDLSKAKSLFEISQPLPEHSEIHHATIHNNGSGKVLIFCLPYTLSSSWLKIQPDTKFLTPVSSLVVNPEISRSDELLQINLSDQQLTITYHKNGNLMAANQFNGKYTNDTLYFTLNFCKSLNVDLTTVRVKISGDAINSSEIVKKLTGYFKNIATDAYTNSIHFCYQLLRYRTKYHTLFYSPGICE